MKCNQCGKGMNSKIDEYYAECPSCGNLASKVMPVPKPEVITIEYGNKEMVLSIDYRNRFLGFTLFFLGLLPFVAGIYFLLYNAEGQKFLNEFTTAMRHEPALFITSLVSSAIWPLLASFWGLAMALNKKVIRLDETSIYKYTKPLMTFSSKYTLSDIKEYIIEKKNMGSSMGSYYQLMAVMKKGAKKELWPADNDPFMTLYIADRIKEHLEGLAESHKDPAYLKFSRAIEQGNADELLSLLDSRPDFAGARAENGHTALTFAVQKGHASLVKLLLSINAPVNKSERRQGKTPLHLASASGNMEFVEKLLSHGAKVNIRDNEGVTPLHYAKSAGHHSIEKVLEAHGGKDEVEVNIKKPSSSKAIYLLILVPILFFTLILSLTGNDINTQARVGNLTRVKSMVEKNPDLVNRKSGKYDEAPLHEAAGQGRLEVVKYLVEKGADVNITTKSGSRPLNQAAYGGHAEVMEYLISKGASASVDKYTGRTLLHLAAGSGNGEAVSMLLKKGYDVNERDKEGKTPLHHAMGSKSMEAAKVLISAGADVNARDNVKDAPGKTPLHSAFTDQEVRLLLRKGADINARDDRGRTPLHYAVERWGGAAEELISSGADVNARDNAGKTPLSYARSSSYLTKFLKEHGAKE